MSDNKIFKLEPSQAAMVFMPIDNKKHKVRIENNVLHIGTKKVDFTYDELESSGYFLYTEFEVKFHTLKSEYSLEPSDYSTDSISDVGMYWYEDGVFVDVREILGYELSKALKEELE